MTGYAAILAGNAGADERAQQIAQLFNVTPNPNLYTEFRLTHVSRAGKLHQHVFNMGKAQADTGDAQNDIPAQRARVQQHRHDLEQASGDIAAVQNVLAVLLGAEKKMKGWSNINLVNMQDTVEELDANAQRVKDMTDALSARDRALDEQEKDMMQREQRINLAAYLKSGISTAAAVSAPKTARFTRKPKAVQP